MKLFFRIGPFPWLQIFEQTLVIGSCIEKGDHCDDDNHSNYTQFTTNVPYVFTNDWYDNRSTDYCVYYMGGDRSGKARVDTLFLINSFDESKFDLSGVEEGTSVKALIEIDAVQTNRYPQLWNIEKLPWE